MVDIRINGRRLHSNHTLADEGAPHKSSQSMLLDQESSLHSQSNTQALLHDQSRQCSSVQAPSNIDLLSFTPCTEKISSSRCMGTPGPAYHFDDELTTAHPSCGPSFAPNTQEPSIQESLPKRRFTIDDQVDEVIAANKGRRNAVFAVPQTPMSNSKGKLCHDYILSPKTLKELDHHYRDFQDLTTDTLSTSSNPNGWLPEPRYNIQRRMQQSVPGTRNAWNEPLHPHQLFWTARTESLSNHHLSTSPLTIFGQAVTPDGGRLGEDWPRWIQCDKPRTQFSPPNKSPPRNTLAELHTTREGLPYATPNMKRDFAL